MHFFKRLNILGFVLIVASVLMVSPLAAQDEGSSRKQPPLPKPTKTQASPERQTAVFKLVNLPAAAIAKSLLKTLDKGVQLEPEPTTNSLIVTGTPDQLQKLFALLQQLDEKPEMIHVEVSLVALNGDQGAITDAIKTAGAGGTRLVAELVESGKVRVLNRWRLSALEDNQAQVRTTEQKLVPAGRNVTSRGGGLRGSSRVYEQREASTLVSVQPVRSGEEVTVELQLESTRLEGLEEAASAAEGEEADLAETQIRTLTTTISTTVRIPQGRPVLIQAATRQDGNSSGQFAVLLTATVGTPPGRALAARPLRHTVAFYLKHTVATDVEKTIKEVYADHTGELTIRADARTNALFVSGDPKLIEQVEDLLKQLDAKVTDPNPVRIEKLLFPSSPGGGRR